MLNGRDERQLKQKKERKNRDRKLVGSGTKWQSWTKGTGTRRFSEVRSEEEIGGAMDVEELETVVIIVDSKAMGNRSAQYDQRASQQHLSILCCSLALLSAPGAARFHPRLTATRDLRCSHYGSL